MKYRYITLLSFFLISVFQLPAAEENTADILKKHVAALVSCKDRSAGSAGAFYAAGYIYDYFDKSDLVMLDGRPGKEFSLTLENGDTLTAVNVAGIVEGYDPMLKNEYIVVAASYDAQGSRKIMIDGKETDVFYPGAYANASGIAVLMELARRARTESFMFRRSVIFVAFGAENESLLSSWYFLNGGFEGISSLSMMINIDMVGRRNRNSELGLFIMGAEKQLAPVMDDMEYEQTGISPALLSSDSRSSSHRMFYASGIPVACFTSGMNPDVNAASDTPDRLDYPLMERTLNYIYGFLMKSANISGEYSRTQPTEVRGDDSGLPTIYEVDERPVFLNGGMETFLEKWVYHYLKYPESSLRNGTKGTVMAEFVIEKDGSVSNVRIVKGLDDAIDDEVVKVISASPKWKPAKNKGVKTRVKVSLPVEFRLR